MWLVDSLISIGSGANCKIIIHDPLVEELHAELHIHDNVIEFVHKAKAKSSFVNGALVAIRTTLKAWDVIRIGQVELEVIDPLLNRSPKQRAAPQATQLRPALSDWMIQAQTAPHSGQLFPISRTTVIGRDADADISIQLPYVSRRHVQLSLQNDQLQIKDLSSANGTYVNNEKVAEAPLNDGDEIRLDDFKFKVIFTGTHETKAKPKPTHIRVPSAKSEPTSKYPTPPSIDGTELIKEDEVAFFHGKDPSVRGKVYEVKSSGSPIGRMLGHHLSRDDSSVSARHVEVFKKGRFWSIKNNGAANGLIVNGRMTTRATLVDGDEVTIGGMALIFQCEGKSPRKLFAESSNSELNITKVAIGLAITAIVIFLGISTFLS